jgi:hypothetical protein
MISKLKPPSKFLILILVLSLLAIPAAVLADWDPDDPYGPCYKMHFPQLPDLENGIDIFAGRYEYPPGSMDVRVELADDFLCTETGNITDIHIWGSWLDDDVDNEAIFYLAIWDNIPANESPTGYSMPGNMLWGIQLMPGEYTVRDYATVTDEVFYDPLTGAFGTDNTVYQYNFNIDPSLAFEQQEGNIYWLSVEAASSSQEAVNFGWKTSQNHWEDDAVWRMVSTGGSSDWEELRYPTGHPNEGESIDMAFVITSETGTIILHKETIPDGSTQMFDIIDADTSALMMSIDDGNYYSLNCLEPGTYRWKEDVPPYWNLTNVVLEDPNDNSSYDPATGIITFELDAGENITAIFTNRYVPPENPPIEPQVGAPVGIDVYPVDKFGLLAPWIALTIAVVAGGVLLLIRRKAHS